LLKLRAQDGSDLEIISAHMQDALIRVSDILFKRKSRQFAFVANRFAWEAAPAAERRRTGLHFENVTHAQRKGFSEGDSGLILYLLSMTFTETDAPRGRVELTFSASHSIQLDVEYLDCTLRDLGPAWSASGMPDHG
jgi:hypothetical protein